MQPVTDTSQPAEPAIRMVVGLGNPGRRYTQTRHNIGFMVVDWLAAQAAASAWRSDRRAEVTRIGVGGTGVLLVKPQTFMNASGEAVQALAAWHRVEPAAILVVTDDLDLPFGRVRLRPSGSAGGHNGLKSIIAQLGTTQFPRLRIGIGRPEVGDPIDWVLSPFDPHEAQDLPRLCEVAGGIALDAVRVGVHTAMNLHNGRGDIRGSAPASAPPPRIAPSPDPPADRCGSKTTAI
jgi:PTH1 family peptidyl-tRNA hydrolase